MIGSGLPRSGLKTVAENGARRVDMHAWGLMKTGCVGVLIWRHHISRPKWVLCTVWPVFSSCALVPQGLDEQLI